MKKLTTKELNYFFTEKPSISKGSFAEECGITQSLFYKMLYGERKISESNANKITKTAAKYCYKF